MITIEHLEDRWRLRGVPFGYTENDCDYVLGHKPPHYPVPAKYHVLLDESYVGKDGVFDHLVCVGEIIFAQ